MGLQRGVLEGPRETGLECLPGHHVIAPGSWILCITTKLMIGMYSDLEAQRTQNVVKV